MSDLTDFDLSRWIERWRASLAQSTAIGEAELDELTDHLVCAIEAELHRGAPPVVAFRAAAEQLGDPSVLRQEYERLRRPMSATRKVVLTLFAATPLLVAAWPVGLTCFVHVPSLILVTSLIATGLCACFGPRAVVDAFRAALGESRIADFETLARHEAVFRRGYRLAWASGLLGALFGVVSVLTNLSDPATIGPGLALCLLSTLYAAVLAELGFKNLQQWVENQGPIAVATR